MYFKNKVKNQYLYISENPWRILPQKVTVLTAIKSTHYLIDYLNSCIKITICWTGFITVKLCWYFLWNGIFFWIYVTTSEKVCFFCLPQLDVYIFWVHLYTISVSAGLPWSWCVTLCPFWFHSISLYFFMNIYFNLVNKALQLIVNVINNIFLKIKVLMSWTLLYRLKC